MSAVQASPVLATLPSMNEIARVGRQRGLALIIPPLKDRSGQLTSVRSFDNCTIIEVT